jgi:competence protein ComEC
MRSVIGGFTLGILLLQQQASLQSWVCLAGLGFLAVALLAVSLSIPSSLLRVAGKVIGGTVIGWCWASVMALSAMSHQLAQQYEERDITVVGVVASLPAASEYGQRFQFNIEHVLTAGVDAERIPDKVLLSWFDANTSIADVVSIRPGERWQLNVRLRRPHGLANPHGFDYEVWLLEQKLGATGSVRLDKPGQQYANRRLTDFVFSLKNCIEWSRGKLRDRILTALPDPSNAPVVVALVIGDQNAIAQTDWTVFARTGVSHLIAISGLHISMLAGMAWAALFYLWRKSFFTRFNLPLYLPAQKAAALFSVLIALMYVALAGFGVPYLAHDLRSRRCAMDGPACQHR